MSTTYWSPEWREKTLSSIRSNAHFDLIVVGGGITGAGIYREACARGLKVLLLEQQDFAWGTSSRSSKMVHGGLRYLAKGQFGLAKDSVTERQKLSEQLSGLVDPLPFLMGHYKGGFPGPWIFDKLLAIYDWFAGKRYRSFEKHGARDFLSPGIRDKELLGVTRYMDAVTDDARLVVRTLQDGNAQGGVALNYLKVTGLMRSGSDLDQSTQVIGVYVQDQETDEEFQIQADVVVNATGAWTDELRRMLGRKRQVRPLRGSHLVVPFWRLPVAFSVSFFHPKDKRPVFVFPWEGQTVIGTTDLDHRDSLNQEATITSEELAYLLEGANHQFSHAQLSSNDVVASWSGVRPVVTEEQEEGEQEDTNPSDEKREHMVWDDKGCISIAGGKLTTFRLLAIEVLEAAQPYLSAKLSRQDLQSPTDFEDPQLVNDHRLSSQRFRRLIGRYGVNTEALVGAACADDLLPLGTSESCLQELLWACEHESVIHLDDLLLRRVRLGMLFQNGAFKLIAPYSELLREKLQWSQEKWDREWQRYLDIADRYYGVPKQDVSSQSREVA